MAGNNTIQRRTQETAAARTQEGARPTIQQYIKQMAPAIKAALPAVMTPERFTRITLSALSSAPKLQECTPTSFLGAMMTAAQLGVEPNTPLGQAYLIPYKRNFKEGGQWQSVMECQFQLGYKGLIDLAYRSGEVSTIMAQVVYEKDEFYGRQKGPGGRWPAEGETGGKGEAERVYLDPPQLCAGQGCPT